MNTPEREALRAFRQQVYTLFGCRRDALFETLDAVLSAPTLETPAHLSLAPTCQRRWGSLYDALNAGTMDLTHLERLIASYPLEAQTTWFAVDASVWPRCDAETSPDRGYYHHPYRHSHGQPIVAGWNYSWLVQVPLRCSSWTAPLRVRRIIPGENVNVVAAEQIRSWLEQLEQMTPPASAPIFTFDAGYDPVQLSLALDDLPLCLLVRLRAGRCFYADPTSQPETGRPRRHGAKFVCDDPMTWPAPSCAWTTTDPQHGVVCLRRGVACTPPHKTTPPVAHGAHARWCAELSFVWKSRACRVRPNERNHSGSGGTGQTRPIWRTSGGPISLASRLSIPSGSSSRHFTGRRRSCARLTRLIAGRGCSSWPIVTCAWRALPSPTYAYLGSSRCRQSGGHLHACAGAFRTSSRIWAAQSPCQNPVDVRRDGPKASAHSPPNGFRQSN